MMRLLGLEGAARGVRGSEFRVVYGVVRFKALGASNGVTP